MVDFRRNISQGKIATKERLGLILATIIIIVLATTLIFKNGAKKPAITSENKQISKVAIEPSGIKYPKDWQELTQISTVDKQAGVISEASLNNSIASAVVRETPSALASNFNIDKTLSDTVNKLKESISGFSLIKKEIFKVGDEEAIHVQYQYSDGNQVYTQDQIIIPSAKATYYLTITAQKDDFKLIPSLNQLNSALAVYIKTRSNK